MLSAICFCVSMKILLAALPVPLLRRRDRLLDAAQGGDRDTVQVLALIAGHPDQIKTPLGQTALWLAADANHCLITRDLLYAGANPDVKDIYGVSPLTRAAASGHYVPLRMMTRFRPDLFPSATASLGLWHAISNRHLQALRILLRAGTSANYTPRGKSPPLHTAVRSFPESVMDLVTFGADVNKLDDQGRTPLHIAAEVDNFDTARLLLDSLARMDIQDNNGHLPFDLAHSFRMRELLQL